MTKHIDRSHQINTSQKKQTFFLKQLATGSGITGNLYFFKLSFVFQVLNMLYLFNQKSRVIFFNECKLYVRSQQISVQV